MSEVPSSPEPFFREYVPAHLARLEGALAQYTSPGAVAFEVGAESYSLRLTEGKLSVERGVASDALLTVRLGEPDFRAVVVAGAARLDDGAGLERQLVAVRALTLDAERARLLRESRGTVLLRLADAGEERRLLVTVGGASEAPTAECEIACDLEALWAIQSGAANPIQLLLDGKVRITGNAELALGVAAALG